MLFQSSLARGVAAVTAADLRSGLARGLVFNPVALALSLIVIGPVLKPVKKVAAEGGGP